MHNEDIYFSCAHKIWMNHNFLNGMLFFKWRFSISAIFGIWHDCNVSNFCICKFSKTMCCSNHKMGWNNWSRAEIVFWVSLTIMLWVMKWYHEAPSFFWGRKSVIIYISEDTFRKEPTKICDRFAVHNSFIHCYDKMKTHTKEKEHIV